MIKLAQPHFLAKESGFFYCRPADSEGFMPIHIKPAQDGFFGEQIYISCCYRNDVSLTPASYADQRVGV